MFVWLSRMLLLGAVALAGLASWQMARTPHEIKDAGPPLVIDWPAPELGEMGVGGHEVVVRLSNPSARIRYVIGMLSGCRENVCFKPKVAEPVAIPPGETVTYVCEFD